MAFESGGECRQSCVAKINRLGVGLDFGGW